MGMAPYLTGEGAMGGGGAWFPILQMIGQRGGGGGCHMGMAPYLTGEGAKGVGYDGGEGQP